MISVYRYKSAFQKLLHPLLKAFYNIGLTANQITISAVILSILLGYLFLSYQHNPLILLVLPFGLLLRMALNALDGMMARQYKMQSQLGEILNELGDIISDIVIIFPLLVIPGASPYIIVLFAILTIINEFSGLLGRALGGERRYDGPMGKSDRAFVIGLFCIVDFFWRGVELYTNWVFGVVCILIVISTLTRLRKTLQ